MKFHRKGGDKSWRTMKTNALGLNLGQCFQTVGYYPLVAYNVSNVVIGIFNLNRK